MPEIGTGGGSGVDVDTPGMTNPLTLGGDMIVGSGSAVTLTNGLNAVASGQSLFYGTINGPLQASPNNTRVGVNGGIIGIVVDFGAPTTVASFTANPFRTQSNGATMYGLESSPDNVTWTRQATWANPGAAGVDHNETLAVPVTARYWRCTLVVNTGDAALEIDKFWLFGVQGAPIALHAGGGGQGLTIDPTTLLPSWQGDTAWHVVGVGGEPAFVGTWANYGSGQVPARFRKLASGLVVVEGVIHSGTIGTNAFTLPAGYRPAYPLAFTTSDTGSVMHVIAVGADGTVTPNLSDSFAVSLAGITFLAEG